MNEERSFLALVHDTGKIKKNSRVGIGFSSEEPISVFMRSSTTLAELQNTILQKLGVTGSKRVSKLFYRAHVAIFSEHVKYGSFVVQTDADLKLWRIEPDSSICSHRGSSSSAPVSPVVPVIPPSVSSPSFAADLHREDDDQCDLEDNRTFGELVMAVANNPRTPLRGVQISEPEGVEEALCEDEEEDEPELVPEDSDDDDQSILIPRREPASYGSHQYPEHFSSLDLEVVAPTHTENDASAEFDGGGSVDVLMPNEFEIGQ
ncbi:hypothetical protein PIB30_081128 [Stylosanthes scabra]|uniref:Uncharacterized protein n=1 Tax=Stylosanthes scabra TaxID=79078 RepID=A0ABU6TSX6_9FABA|nr:hypothetical protein [Stylosanthes scabra]